MGEQTAIKDKINTLVFPMLSKSVRAVAQQVTSDWQEAVYKAKLWTGEKDPYANSIKWEMTGNYSAVVSSGYKHAGEIETGRPAKDLKVMLNTSQKVRQTKDGRRFLVIPMRHNTSGSNGHAAAMPSSVYAIAKAMKPTKVISQGQRPSGQITHLSPKSGMSPATKQSVFLSNPKTKQAAMVTASKYAWGGRLTAGALKAAGVDAAGAKRYAGMVRMDTSSPNGGKSSSYMTFRIMMEGSSGWVIPAKPGLFLARTVAVQMQPKAMAAFKEAIKAAVSG
jgi:hypothetical protein